MFYDVGSVVISKKTTSPVATASQTADVFKITRTQGGVFCVGWFSMQGFFGNVLLTLSP
jgi:hypothetical protein